MTPDDLVKLLLTLAARGPLRFRRCFLRSSAFYGAGRFLFIAHIPQGGLERLDGFELARDLGQFLLSGLDALLGLFSGLDQALAIPRDDRLRLKLFHDVLLR